MLTAISREASLSGELDGSCENPKRVDATHDSSSAIYTVPSWRSCSSLHSRGKLLFTCEHRSRCAVAFDSSSAHSNFSRPLKVATKQTMSEDQPSHDTLGRVELHNDTRFAVMLARSLNEKMHVAAIAAIFLSEQRCHFCEESLTASRRFGTLHLIRWGLDHEH